MSVVDRSSRLLKPLVGARDTRSPEPVPDTKRLLATPQDIVEADATRARAIYEGTFTFGRTTRVLQPDSFFDGTPATGAADRHWAASLHGFQWLRDIAANTAPTARLNGAALVMDWIDACGIPTSGRSKSIAWNPDVAATRLMAWLRHGEGLFDLPAPHPEQDSANIRPNDTRPQSWFRSLVRHTRFLNTVVTDAPAGEIRLRVRIALAMAAICIDGRDRSVERAIKALEQELVRQVAPDGGHMSRNPAAQVRLLCDLLPLLRLYRDTGKPAPDILASKAARMVEALRFFRHSHGRLAQFNGTGTIDDDLVGRLLRFDGVEGRPVASLGQTGFDRLASGRTVVLVDTGSASVPDAAPDAMAGALSFEMSSGGHRFIMNCGWPDVAYADYRDLSRATAAHSTLTIADTSSARLAGAASAQKGAFSFLAGRGMGKAPLSVTRKRTDDAERKSLSASHDGYAAQFGFHHERDLDLLEGGNTLQGRDRLHPTEQATPTTATIRFHVPPDISVSHLASGHSILLATGAGKGATQAWTFTCIDVAVMLEESIRFDGRNTGDPPRKAMQIVLSFDVSPDRTTEIRWTLQRNVQTGRQQGGETKPLDAVGDLLTMLEDVPPQSTSDAENGSR